MSGIKIVKFLGGVVEVCFLVSFIYECGKAAGRRELEEELEESKNNPKKRNTFVDILKNVNTNTAKKTARFVTVDC